MDLKYKFRMRFNNRLQVALVWLCLLGGLQTSYAQGLEVGIRFLPGIGNVKLDESVLSGNELTNDMKFALQFQADASYFFSKNLGVGLGLGYARYTSENFYDTWGFSRVFESTPTGTDYYDFDNPDVRYGYTLYDTMQINSEVLSVSSIDLPLLLKLRIGDPDEVRFFVEAGPVFSFGNKGRYRGEGIASYEADFTDVDIHVFDTGFGFRDDVPISSVKSDLPGFSSTNLSAMAAAGVIFPIKDNISLHAGAVYKRGLKDLLDAGGQGKVNAGIKEGSNTYYSLAAASENVKTSHLGLTFGVNYNLSLESVKGCDQLQSIPIRYKQFEANRRGQGQDPEFSVVVEEAKKYMNFRQRKTSLLTSATGDYVEFCSNLVTLYEISHAIKNNPYFNEMDEFRGAVNEKIYEIKLATKRFDISLQPYDSKSNQELNQFDAEVLYRGVTVWNLKKLNYNDPARKLYAHPDINYEVQVSRAGYNDTVVFISRADVQARTLRIPLSKQGLRTISKISGFENVPDQKVNISRSELSSSARAEIKDGSLEIKIAPELEGPVGSYLIQINKPIGYDIYQGNKGDWRRDKTVIRIKDGEPEGDITVEKLPVFNLFYIDLSDTDERKEIQDTLNTWFQKIRKSKSKDQYYAFLTNGGNSLETTHEENPNDFLVTVGLVNPDPPNGNLDREKMLSALSAQMGSLTPDRKQLVLHYFLSRTIHEQSLLELEDKLVKNFGENWENIRIRIYTHYPVKPEDRIQGKYKSRVAYFQLK